MFGFCAIAVCLVVLFAFRGDASELQASSLDSDADQAAQGGSLGNAKSKNGPTEEGSVQDVKPEKPPAETAAKETHVASQDERKIRVVFKPVIKEDGKAESPSITVELPEKKAVVKQGTAVEIEGLPQQVRKGPIAKWLNKRRGIVPTRLRDGRNESTAKEQSATENDTP